MTAQVVRLMGGSFDGETAVRVESSRLLYRTLDRGGRRFREMYVPYEDEPSFDGLPVMVFALRMYDGDLRPPAAPARP